MKYKNLKIPAIIMAIGLILVVAAHLLTSIQRKPVITEQNFDYSITYKVDGETKTLNGVYTCRFNGFGSNGIDPLYRYYEGEHTVGGDKMDSRRYTIAEKDGFEFYIVSLFDDGYLMGDPQDEPYDGLQPPFIEAIDKEGNQYSETDLPNVLEAKIISWEYPNPIKNTFRFDGFSGFYVVSFGAMMLAGLLTLILCMIFVRKGEGVVYSALDIIGIVLNFATMFMALPILSIAVCFIQAYKIGPDWIYQLYFCIPPIILFSIAASVSLRRKGFKFGGFFSQFIGGVLLVIISILEYIT